MCSTPDIKAPPPPPAPPPVLEQTAPKSADSTSTQAAKRQGLSRYKISGPSVKSSKTNKLGGIPKKSGTGN